MENIVTSFTSQEVVGVEYGELYKFKLEKGKNYKIENTSEEIVNIRNTSSYNNRFDIIHYNKDGSIKNFYKNEYGILQLGNQESKKITIGENTDIECWLPLEQKSQINVEEIEEPALYEFRLEVGKNYEIANGSMDRVNIQNNSSYNLLYDLVKYKQDLSYQFLVGRSGSILLDPNELILISPQNNNSKSIECYIPYEHYKNGIGIRELEYKITDIFFMHRDATSPHPYSFFW